MNKNSLYKYVRSKKNSYKHGGKLDEVSEQFNSFNTGNSHEVNPNGGIPLGMGQNGLPNTVEQNETSFDFEDGKYIFSDRLNFDTQSSKVNPSFKDLFKKYKK